MDGQDKLNLIKNEPPAPFSSASFAEHAAAHKPSKAPNRHWKKPLLSFIILIVLVAAAGGGYWLFKHHHKTPVHTNTTPTVQRPVPSASTSSTIAQYVSNGKDLNLSLNYPSDWTVAPPTNSNPSDQPITLNSPLTAITAASGETATGKVTVSIRPGSAQINELSSGGVTAAQNSVQFAYTKPTAVQYKYPYLTFLNVSGASDPTGTFAEVIITGTTQFAKANPVTAADLTTLDPIISASFYECSTKACSGSGASSLNITDATWQNASLFKQVQALFSSLQLH